MKENIDVKKHGFSHWTPDRNFVFIHIPKSGGTSIRTYLENYFSEDDIFNGVNLLNYPNYEDLKINRPMLLVSHFGYSFFRQSGGFSMTVLRDPVERILSLFSYWKDPGKGRPPGPSLPADMDLRGFLNSNIPYIWMNINNAQTWQLAFCHNLKTRKRFRNIRPYELLDIAIKNLRSFDIVGVCEDMNQVKDQIDNLFSKLGVCKDSGAVIDRKNISRSRLDAADIDVELIDMIKRKTKLDSALYKEAVNLSNKKIT